MRYTFSVSLHAVQVPVPKIKTVLLVAYALSNKDSIAWPAGVVPLKAQRFGVVLAWQPGGVVRDPL